MRLRLSAMLVLATVGCGESYVFVQAPDEVAFVAALGVDIEGAVIATSLEPAESSTVLNLDPPPETLTIFGLAAEDLSPFERMRARWTVDPVVIPKACEVQLPAARWAVALEADGFETLPVVDIPRLTTAWIDEARDCTTLDVEVEVRCGGTIVACLPTEASTGACGFSVPLCASTGGRILAVELEDQDRACATEFQGCTAGDQDGALALECPALSGETCTAIVHGFDQARTPVEVTRVSKLPHVQPFDPPEGNRRDALTFGNFQPGIGVDFVIVEQRIVVVGLPDPQGGLAPRQGRFCEPEEPRAFLFFDAESGAPIEALDRPAPPCLSWLEPVPGGFVGLRPVDRVAFELIRFDPLGVQTSTLGFAPDEALQVGKVQALRLVAGPSPDQLLLALRGGNLDPDLNQDSELLHFRASEDEPLRIRWRRKFAVDGLETSFRSTGVLGDDRVLAVDDRVDELTWYDADTGENLGGTVVEPFQTVYVDYGPSWTDPFSRTVYFPVTGTYGGVFSVDAEGHQEGLGEYVANRAGTSVVGLGPAPQAPFVFLYDPATLEANVTRLVRGPHSHLHPHQISLPGMGPVYRVRSYGEGAWALQPWSGTLVRLELPAGE